MNTRRIAVMGLSIAFVFVMVRFLQVPIPGSGGFTHPGAVAEIFVALAFGPIVGLIAAGIGASLADLTSGYAQFAPLTLLAHGALGFLAGYLGWKKGRGRKISGWIVGGLALIAVYFSGFVLLPQLYGGFPAAIAELPFNTFQVLLGVVGLLLLEVVRAAYPQVEQIAEEASFEEL